MTVVTDTNGATADQAASAVAERVLIVEDDSAARVGLEQLVKSWGFVAESATDGEDALEKVTSFRPAIVISDLVMPRHGRPGPPARAAVSRAPTSRRCC